MKHASFDQTSNRMLFLTEPYSNNIIKIIKDIMNTTNRSMDAVLCYFIMEI